MYFIAIIPPQEICDAITEFKKDFADRFNSKTALKIIPHITLKAPFAFSPADIEQVLQWFNHMAVSVPSFEQELKDFGAFRNRRNPVIFVKPVSNESLRKLQNEVIQNFEGTDAAGQVMEQELEFNPHITIAYRDLQPAMFKKAWPEYRLKSFNAMFDVNDFHLMQHDGRMWNSVSNFSLKESVQ